MLLAVMDELLGTLTDREREILRLRFGLEDGRNRTLKEIGKEFNVSRERICQIEAKALRKLRHPSRSRRLHNLTLLPESRRHPGLRGYVNLQAEIFGADREDFYRRYGLTCFLRKRPLCRSCGAPIEKGKKKFCSRCGSVPVVCDVCGRLVQRMRAYVLQAAKHGYKGQYCSKACLSHTIGIQNRLDFRGLRRNSTWEGIPTSVVGEVLTR